MDRMETDSDLKKLGLLLRTLVLSKMTRNWSYFVFLFWSVKRTLARVKKLHAREFSRNQLILRFEVILQHDWPAEQCLLHIRVFFGGKTKRPCFDLLRQQKKNTYQNRFSRSYENRSISILELQVWRENSDWEYLDAVHMYPDICEDRFFSPF